MFDPQKYDTRMRDPEGKRKKPSEEALHRHLPDEARLRRRPETRYDEKRAESPLPRPEKKARTRSAPRAWWPLAALGFVVLVVWRFAAGEVGQGLVLLALAGLGLLVFSARRRTLRPSRPPPRPAGRQRIQPRTRPAGARPRRGTPPPLPAHRRAHGTTPAQRMSAWGIVVALSAVGSVAGAISKACKPGRTDRSVHRVEWQEPSPVRVAPPVPHVPSPPRDPLAPLEWRPHVPPAAPDRITGAVLFGAERAVPRVGVLAQTAAGRSVQGAADEHGVFVFDEVTEAHAELEVHGAVHLGAHPRPTARLAAGTHAGTIPVHPDHALLLLVDKSLGWFSKDRADVQVAATNGELRGEGTWPLPHEVALVTGLARAEFYDVLVQARGDELAGLVERVAPGQRVVVTMKPASTVSGRVELSPGARSIDVEIVLTHGELRVTTRVAADGAWRAPCLPRDSWWDVTAGHAEGRAATHRGVHAVDGASLVLDLR